jgi:hypothetical protein
MKLRYLVIANLISLACMLGSLPVSATEVFLTDDLTTTNYINTPSTTAVVDTSAHEIRLPYEIKGNAINLKAGSLDYVVINNQDIETYSFNGTGMQLNSSLSVSGITNPIGVTTQMNVTDMVVISGTTATRYMFNGTNLSSSPLLSVTGLTMPVSVSSRPLTDDLAVLESTGVKYFNFTGAGMTQNPTLSITAGLTNPIGVSLHSTTYDTVVIDGDKTIKYFKFDGTAMSAVPALQISGLTNPVSVNLKDNGDIVVLDDKSVKYYSFDGTGYIQNAVLSIAGLVDPIALSTRPDSFDYAVIDNGAVKYYSFTGSMTYNPTLSVNGIQVLRTYKTSATIRSVLSNAAAAVNILTLTATENKPANTNITYEVTANGGANWTAVTLGTPTTILNPGVQVGWRATLSTTDQAVTPKIQPVIELMSGTPPEARNLTVTPKNAQGYVTSIIPTLGWEFYDADVGDTQSAYQIQIYRTDTGALVRDTGKIASAAVQYQVPYGVLGATNKYWWRVRLWDNWDVPGNWTTNIMANANFTLLALYDYSVTNIVNPPASPPHPVNPPLPTLTFPVYIKAGSNFSFSVKSAGQFDQVQAEFSFGSIINLTPSNPAGSITNTWSGTTFPPATLATDTTISVTLRGRHNADGAEGTLTVPDFAIIKGSVLQDYITVLTR